MSIYFDYNATAPLRPVARDVMLRAFDAVGNPSSVHGPGRAAKAAMENARTSLAKLVSCRPTDVIFTSGGTESNNLAISNAIAAWGCKSVLYCATEHPSIAAPAERSGASAVMVPVMDNGKVDMAALQANIDVQNNPFLLCIMLANNETGLLQSVPEIAELVHQSGGFLHVDAAQAFGKVPVDFAGSGADSMSLVSHKTGGPNGVGALVVACGLAVSAQLVGGGQEEGRRAGTSNVPGIVGFVAAAEEACEQLEQFAQLSELREHLADLLRVYAPDLVVFSQGEDRLPNTLCCAASGFAAETQVMALDLAGFAISSGSACGSGKVKASHVLTAMGVSDELARCAIRISLGWLSTEDQVEQFAIQWGEAYERSHVREVA